MTQSLSAAQARRIGLAAQGFGGRARSAQPTSRTIADAVQRLRVLQIDSVNVWERSHYMPLFARLGAYDKGRLDQLTEGSTPLLTEYWGHEATLLPVDDLPLFGFRMRSFRDKYGTPEAMAETAHLREWLLAELRDRGPLRASDIEHEQNKRSNRYWWGWSAVKHSLELMFLFGDLAVASRIGFERRYALREQMLPPHVLNAEIAKDDAVRELVRRAAIAHGVATADDLADYFRLRKPDATAAIADLVDAGDLVPVEVEGWTKRDRPLPAWLHRDAAIPARLSRTALLSPFDPVVWHRDRALRMHDFHYRIEIYTPAHKRVYGYYSLPVIVGDQVAARVDLKNDRKRRVLMVRSAWREGHARADCAERIAVALRDAAAWQGLDSFEMADWGDLAPALAAELGVPLTPRE